MTINDNWLLERAEKRKAARLRSTSPDPALRDPGTRPPVDDLWARLQRETRRQAAVYTDALGEPDAVTIETTLDSIAVKVPDGRQLTLRLDRATRRLSETFQDSSGAVRIRRPITSIIPDADGGWTFNFGGVQPAAGTLLRRLLT
jgi:hypothetical protein